MQNVVYHVVGRDSSAVKFDRAEIAFTLTVFYCLKPLPDEGGQETRVPGKKLLTINFRKCHILKPENSRANRDSNPHPSIGGRPGKQTCYPLHHAWPQFVSIAQRARTRILHLSLFIAVCSAAFESLIFFFLSFFKLEYSF